jgi:hypothetical protein
LATVFSAAGSFFERIAALNARALCHVAKLQYTAGRKEVPKNHRAASRAGTASAQLAIAAYK